MSLNLLNRHLDLSTHVAEIIKPLESLGITGFFYTRIYSDGSFINLASRPDWTEYYFKKLFQGGYCTEDISDQLFSHDGVGLWALNPDNQVWQDAIHHFGYGNGVSLYEENDRMRDITGFYSTVNNHAINRFYINHVDELKKFKNHFISKSTALMLDLEQHTCQLPNAIRQDQSAPIKPDILQQLGITDRPFFSWNDIFQVSMEELDALLVRPRYDFQLDNNRFILSRMEIKSLVQLLKGQHAGEIATSLNLKQTTVESYLSNIKNKLGINSKSQLIQFIVKNQLLQQIK